MEDNSIKFSFRDVLMILALAMAYCISNFQRSALSVLVGTISVEFSLSETQLGTMGSAIFYTYAIMQLPGGFIADRIKTRYLIAGSCLLSAISTVWFALSKGYTSMLLARAVLGVTTALIYVPALAVLRRSFGDKHFGMLTGIVFAFGQLGTVIASLPLKLLSDALGWRNAFYAVAGISLVVAILVWILVEEKQRTGGAPVRSVAPSEGNGTSVWRTLLAPSLLTLTFWFFMKSGTSVSFASVWAAPFFTSVLGVSDTTASVFLMVISISGVLGSVLFGKIADRLGSLNTFVGSSIPLALMWFLMANLKSSLPVAVVYLVISVYGMLSSGTMSAGFSCVRIFSENQNTGKTTGIVNFFSFIATGMFSQITGLFMDLFQQKAVAERYAILLMAFGLLAGLSILLFMLANGMFAHKKSSKRNAA